MKEYEALVNGFVERALTFANQRCDPRDIHEAWRAFRVWLSSWIDYNSDDWRLFLVWYVFHWQAGAEEGDSRPPTVAEYYINSNEDSSPEDRWLLGSASVCPLDFYEIYEFVELGCFYMKSLFLGYQHSFAFPKLPEGLKAGDIFFGKIIHIRDDRGVVAAHSRPFPPSAKVAITALRRQLIQKRKEEFIHNFGLFDSDLFNLYHDLLSEEVAASRV
jgi:hypothetical protein